MLGELGNVSVSVPIVGACGSPNVDTEILDDRIGVGVWETTIGEKLKDDEAILIAALNAVSAF